MKRSNSSSNRRSGRTQRRLSGIGLFSAGLLAGIAANATYEDIGSQAAMASNRARLSIEIPAQIKGAPTARDKALLDDSGVASPSKASVLASWLEMAEAERIKSLAKKVTGAGLDLVAEGVISRLEEDSLKSLIASTTDFSAGELAEN